MKNKRMDKDTAIARLNRAAKFVGAVNNPKILQQFTLDFLSDIQPVHTPSDRDHVATCEYLAHQVEAIIEIMDEDLIDYHVMMVLLRILDHD